MPIEIEKPDAPGEKDTFYSAEEYNAAQQAAERVTSLEAELAESRRLLAERGDNFTKFSQMSDEQKKAFDANTTNLLKREEALTSEIEGLKNTLSERDSRERTSIKTNVFNNIHQNDEKVKAELEKNYDLLDKMPETTPEEISARASAAARMAGIVVDPRNPLYTPVTNGMPPTIKPMSDEFINTPEGKAALEMVNSSLGITSS